MYSLGLDIGYTAVKLAVLDTDNGLAHHAYALHHGQAARTAKTLLDAVSAQPWATRITRVAATGSGAALPGRTGALVCVNEIAALVEGGLHLFPQCASIMEIGGQSAKFVTGFSPADKTRVAVSMNPNCASGTGAFLEEQVSRLGIPIEDYARLAAQACTVPRIAGRCSVFAKTDIIHHQQEGVPVADILRGLAHALVKNYRSAVMRAQPRPAPILFAGGVARNQAIVQALKEILRPGPGDLLLHQAAAATGAIGAALLAKSQEAPHERPFELAQLYAALETTPGPEGIEQTAVLPSLRAFGADDSQGKHRCPPLPESPRPLRCWLGIDVGSTSTNLVLADAEGRVLAYRYLRTAGAPIRAVRDGLASLKEECGRSVEVAGVATTGSGRYMTGRLVGADIVRDEITAQARAAVALDPQVDTVFEIGGQDSKFIALDKGVVTDFQMNKICAAGTGSFIEEQAKKLNIALEEYDWLVFASETPVNLGERCTVFMESSISAHLARGAQVKDLLAGLCYSIVNNYLNRVVGKKRIGRRILLQGGIAHNQGVVNAFRAVTGKKILVPPFFSVSGAYGAALLARDEMPAAATAFKGFDLPAQPEAAQAREPEPKNRSPFTRQVQDFIFADYDGRIDPDKKTVGIPRALFTYGMFPLFYPFFKELGCNVLLSEPTSEQTIALAQDYSLDETCYPLKMINGHAAELVAQKVDYLFFPDLYTVAHPGSKTRQNYGCAYMQLACKMINKAMRLEERGIALLAPTIAFSLGPEFMRGAFLKLGAKLGKSPQETEAALQKSMAGFHAFEQRIEKRRKQSLAALDPQQKTFVLLSKIYGVADPMLHLGIPDKLRELGCATIPFYDLPEADIFADHPNMYWPFAQHILAAAKYVARHPNLYAVFLSHHGCGPDSVTAHYLKEIMGEKPYLAIEVDEHASDVGVCTRVEAFVNSLSHVPVRPVLAPSPAMNNQTTKEQPVRIRAALAKPTRQPLLLPRIFPYTQLLCELLRMGGHDARVLPEGNAASLDLGRKHTMTNEYVSLAALLGDALAALRRLPQNGGRTALLLPQNEGAEVDGQFCRFVRSKLDAEGFGNVDIVAPFLEDLALLDAAGREALFLALLAGDLVLLLPESRRARALQDLAARLRTGKLSLAVLEDLAADIRRELSARNGGKRLLAVGETLVLFNPQLNGGFFSRLEAQGHQVLYAPLAECLWMFWNDHAAQNQAAQTGQYAETLGARIGQISAALGAHSPYAAHLPDLTDAADQSLGLYAGAFGRYRAAKMLRCPEHINGILSVASLYENTAISLGILHNNSASAPVLALAFDGTENTTDRTRLESFLYYI